MNDRGADKADKRKALGRGLAALLPGPGSGGALPSAAAMAKRDFFECAIEDIHPSEDNPRKSFDEARMKELAESIRAQGLVQPLVVRKRDGGDGFTMIAGERRWRAAQRAGLKSVPVVVKDVTARAAFELALVENLQRADLNPIEEAEGYRRLVDEAGYTQEQLGERVGKDRTTITNALRLLKLPSAVRSKVAGGELSMGHARALLGLENPQEIERAALRVVAKQMSVRQTEEFVRKARAGSSSLKSSVKAPSPSAAVRDLEQRLERALGTKVRLTQKDASSGRIEIDYHSLDQLDELIDRFLG